MSSSSAREAGGLGARPGLRLAGAALACGLAGPAAAAGGAIDLCGMEPTFVEDFEELSVSASSNERARWSAHTPWSGDFGDAAFIDPVTGFADVEKNDPFFVKDGILTIRARKGPDGRWTSGLLSSADSTTAGFSQAYGYFEARMKLPPGPGLWPAFWLSSNVRPDDRRPSVEIDVIEYYGQFDDIFHSVLHVWNKVDRDASRGEGFTTDVEPGALTGAFHTYGVDVGEEVITYYLDRREIGRHPTPPEHGAPLTVFVNLALGGGWPIEDAPNPSDLLVDYVHVYAPREGGPPAGGCAE